MKYNMYAVFNKETGIYDGIQLFRSDVLASRSLMASLKASRDLIPEEFSLFRIGEFDNETCIAVVSVSPEKIPLDFSSLYRTEEKMSDVPNQGSVLKDEG